MAATTERAGGDRGWRSFRAALDRDGLNLVAVLDAMPGTPAAALLPDRAGDADDGDGRRRLVLIGNRGGRFWRALQRSGVGGPDPVDTFSLVCARRAFADWLGGGTAARWLYPFGVTVPLQRLGELAGWHYPSPLGLGVHPDYGPWFAYRVALLTSLPLPLSRPPARADAGAGPCAGCSGRPCLDACPAGALRADRAPAMDRCLAQRRAPGSLCAAGCPARLACPVGAPARYPDAQIDYHYRRALRDLDNPN